MGMKNTVEQRGNAIEAVEVAICHIFADPGVDEMGEVAEFIVDKFLAFGIHPNTIINAMKAEQQEKGVPSNEGQ